MTKDEFISVYREIFTDADDTSKLQSLFDKLDNHNGDAIDYVSFVDNLEPEDLPELVSKCRSAGPLTEVPFHNMVSLFQN